MITPSADAAAASGPPTAAVEQAIARLAELDDRPVYEHVAGLDEVHRLLQDALATLDEA